MQIEESGLCCCSMYLLIELIDDALGPLKVQVTDFGRPVDVCQLDTHLAHQQSVVLIGPVNSWAVHVVHLFRCTSDYNLSSCLFVCLYL